MFRKIGRHADYVDDAVSLARNLQALGQIDEARECCNLAIETLENHNLPIDGQLLHHRLAALMLDLHHERTEEFVDKTINSASRAMNRRLEGCMLQLRSLITIQAGNGDDAVEQCKDSIEAFQSIGFELGIRSGMRLLDALRADSAADLGNV
ncbi:MAG: hypothetical protein IH987_05960 [Planctomycetes bacterium]|nr:hypothetical protein [Planctomycetota bacterium]